MRSLLIGVTALGLYFGLEQLIDLHTKGFCFQKILADDLPAYPAWDAPLSTDQQQEMALLLNQPFTLIDSGSECFVFEGQDGQTILKCFKLSFARPVYYRQALFSDEYSSYAYSITEPRSPWIAPFETLRKRIYGIREFRLLRTFLSCKLAYDHLKEETGLLYIHLNPTDTFHQSITLIDRNGAHYSLPIDSSKFLLQKKAELLEPHFIRLLDEGRQEEIDASIASLHDLIRHRCKKGFADRDFMNKNVGFMGNQAIEIDIGSFTPDPDMKQEKMIEQEIQNSTKEFLQWFKKEAQRSLLRSSRQQSLPE